MTDLLPSYARENSMIRLLASKNPSSCCPAQDVLSALGANSQPAVLHWVEEGAFAPSADPVVVLCDSDISDLAWESIRSSWEMGAVVLALSPAPFTRRLSGDSAEKTDRFWHEAAFVDCFQDVLPALENTRLDLHPRYGFLSALLEGKQGFSRAVSPDAREGLHSENEEEFYSAMAVRLGRILPVARYLDNQDFVRLAPLLELSVFGKGTFLLWNVPVADLLSTENPSAWAELIGQLLHAAKFSGQSIKLSTLPRLLPGEEACLELETSGPATSVRLSLSTPDGMHLGSQEVPSSTSRVNWKAVPPSTGTYLVAAELLHEGVVVDRHSTGFLCLGDDEIRQLASGYKPFLRDPSVSSDFLVRDNQPCALTGTSHFPGETWRAGLHDLNGAVIAREMRQLSGMGFNVLRTGVWTHHSQVYLPDGSFTLAGQRALDAYLITALREGLSVQFVFAAFLFNGWDRASDPFHDPLARARVRKAVESFAERYGSLPNAQADLVNEASYGSYNPQRLWNVARPTGSDHEKIAWARWLSHRYATVESLRSAWGTTVGQVPDFGNAPLPEDSAFQHSWDGTEVYICHPPVRDFLDFAAESFSGWLAEMRQALHSHAPAMLFMVGRDEDLRTPMQQREASKGTVDVVNWHQWHYDGVGWIEYVLNRTPGVPCCAQELGVIPCKDARMEEVLADPERAATLERKLLYAHGNWIQWQAWSDPLMDWVKEIKLGIFRIDGTARPYASILASLAAHETQANPWYRGRIEDDVVVIHPTDLYLSPESRLAKPAAIKGILALSHGLRRNPAWLLSTLLEEGVLSTLATRPRLILVPLCQVLSETAFQALVEAAKAGATVAFSGPVAFDPWMREHQGFKNLLGADYRIVPAGSWETCQVAGQDYTINLAQSLNGHDPRKALRKLTRANGTACALLDIPCGLGRILVHPLPLEAGDSSLAIEGYYRHAESLSGAAPLPWESRTVSRHVFVSAVPYERAVSYTLINEGPATRVEFLDRRFERNIAVDLPEGRGARLLLGADGFASAYATGHVSIDGITLTNGQALHGLRRGNNA